MLPLVLNVAAVLMIVGGVLLLMSLFNQQERDLVISSTQVPSAETQLLRALKEETEAQLSVKDREILRIEDRLRGMRADWEQLQQEGEVQIAAKLEQLRLEMAAELNSERERLQQQGLSQAQIDTQLQDLENRLTRESEQQLDSFRQETEAQLA